MKSETEVRRMLGCRNGTGVIVPVAQTGTKLPTTAMRRGVLDALPANPMYFLLRSEVG